MENNVIIIAIIMILLNICSSSSNLVHINKTKNILPVCETTNSCNLTNRNGTCTHTNNACQIGTTESHLACGSDCKCCSGNCSANISGFGSWNGTNKNESINFEEILGNISLSFNFNSSFQTIQDSITEDPIFKFLFTTFNATETHAIEFKLYEDSNCSSFIFSIAERADQPINNLGFNLTSNCSDIFYFIVLVNDNIPLSSSVIYNEFGKCFGVEVCCEKCQQLSSCTEEDGICIKKNEECPELTVPSNTILCNEKNNCKCCIPKIECSKNNECIDYDPHICNKNKICDKNIDLDSLTKCISDKIIPDNHLPLSLNCTETEICECYGINSNKLCLYKGLVEENVCKENGNKCFSNKCSYPLIQSYDTCGGSNGCICCKMNKECIKDSKYFEKNNCRNGYPWPVPNSSLFKNNNIHKNKCITEYYTLCDYLLIDILDTEKTYDIKYGDDWNDLAYNFVIGILNNATVNNYTSSMNNIFYESYKLLITCKQFKEDSKDKSYMYIDMLYKYNNGKLNIEKCDKNNWNSGSKNNNSGNNNKWNLSPSDINMLVIICFFTVLFFIFIIIIAINKYSKSDNDELSNYLENNSENVNLLFEDITNNESEYPLSNIES